MAIALREWLSDTLFREESFYSTLARVFVSKDGSFAGNAHYWHTIPTNLPN